MFIFTIYDAVSKKAGNVFTTSTIGEAERQFHDALNNAQIGSLFKTHPEDFSLQLIGEFDEDKIEIVDTTSKTITHGKKPVANLNTVAPAIYPEYRDNPTGETA